jgi:hypothetical protein
MKPDHAQRLLDRIAVLLHPCDLDLLIFVARHRRILLPNEQIAGFLGYEVTQIDASLDLLAGAGLVTQMWNRTRGAQMCVLAAADSSREWLPDLLRVASTREGRLAMLQALKRGEPELPATPATRPGSNGDQRVEGADARP